MVNPPPGGSRVRREGSPISALRGAAHDLPEASSAQDPLRDGWCKRAERGNGAKDEPAAECTLNRVNVTNDRRGPIGDEGDEVPDRKAPDGERQVGEPAPDRGTEQRVESKQAGNHASASNDPRR